MIGIRKSTKALMHLAVILTLAGMYPSAEAQVQNLTVGLKVNAGQTGVDVTSHGSCANHNHNGCVVKCNRFAIRSTNVNTLLRTGHACDNGHLRVYHKFIMLYYRPLL